MTQTEAILAHLKEAPITPLEALDKYRCFRLAGRINDLRKLGHPIQTDMISVNGKVYARYSLPKGQIDFFAQQKGLCGGSPSEASRAALGNAAVTAAQNR